MLLTLVFLTLGITVESSSYYMTDCTVAITCPDDIPVSCEKGKRNYHLHNDHFCCIYLNPEPYYTDCKELYANGSTSSGVYTINPDEGTPFEVSVYICCLETVI